MLFGRIEVELDASANGDATEPANSVHVATPGIAAKTITLVGGGLLALVVLFFIIKKSLKRTEDNKLKPRTQQNDTPKEQQGLPAMAADTIHYMQPVPLPKTNMKSADSSVVNNEFLIPKDAALELLLALPQKDSSPSLNVSPRKETSVDSSLLQMVPKKPRGLQIPNNEYKMQSSKLDSVKNRQ